MKFLSELFLFLFFLLFSACSQSYSGEFLFVDPDSADAFNYPYFLYLPEDIPSGNDTYLIVETYRHIGHSQPEAAKNDITDFFKAASKILNEAIKSIKML